MVDTELEQNEVQRRLPSVVSLTLSQITCGPFTCNSCRLSFTSQNHLNHHSFSDREFFQCPSCSLQFSNRKGMRQHFGKKHAKSKPYRCSICLKKFKNVYAVRTHKQQVHLHKSRQTCPHCGKNVFNKFSLSRHFTICDKLMNS